MKKRGINSFEEGESKGGKKIVIASAFLVAVFTLFNPGCKKADDLVTHDENTMSETGMRDSYSLLYTVSDAIGYHPVHIDNALINPWGMGFSSQGYTWVAAEGSGRALVYDSDGNTAATPKTIPSADGTDGGHPTGIVFNPGRGFIIPATHEASRWIFCTKDGTIAAVGYGDRAVTVVNRSGEDCVYTGLAIAYFDGSYRLYATDFRHARVDVFNEGFQLIRSNGFIDPRMPAGYAPFGIRAFGDKIVVTYARQNDKGDDAIDGLGNGFVDLYKTNGELIRRFASGGTLNAPWGIETFITRRSGVSSNLTLNSDRRTLLIGNFGDGHINIYDGNGRFLGQMMNNGEAIGIDGLWAISYKPGAVDGRLYFTAGPKDETHGLLGYIRAN